ncbi:hypothetical protein M6B38_320975 [Iris pallida]|uniref:Uncharacterized protein n=1 Tax=Iris pallida TaxID=29817 RepID=A0AAX6HBT8_IRIPA|nr:hypothetical protein M6B38_320975 [Iris pallida]
MDVMGLGARDSWTDEVDNVVVGLPPKNDMVRLGTILVEDSVSLGHPLYCHSAPLESGSREPSQRSGRPIPSSFGY